MPEDFVLRFANGRLQLLDARNEKQKPLFFEFPAASAPKRADRAHLLAKAVGLPTLQEPRRILDATAGRGTDAWLLASLGCQVLGLERSTTVFALLEDALRRAREESPLSETVQRLNFTCVDALTYLSSIAERDRPHVIYLDPMFPEPRKSALPKKDMQILRALLGHENRAETLELLRVALATARERVVIKRPPHAEALLRKPTHSYEGKSARFDMYRV